MHDERSLYINAVFLVPERQTEAAFTARQVGLGPESPVRVCTTRFGVEQHQFFRVPGARMLPDGLDHQYIEINAPIWPETVPHRHEFYEIAMFRSGTVMPVGLPACESLTRGDVIVMTPEALHGYKHNEAACWTDLYLLPDWLLDDLRLLWNVKGLVRRLLAHALLRAPIEGGMIHFRTTPEETDAWEREVVAMEEASKVPEPCLAMINGCFLKVLGVLSQAYARQASGDEMPIRPEMWRAAYEIERMLRTGIRFDATDLAAALCVSVRQLERSFARWAGTSPADYYQRRRVGHARRLLLSPELTITDVAFELGFADGAHFTKVFQRFEGCTPTAYRRSQGIMGRASQPAD